MVRLLFLALIAAAGWYGWRVLQRQQERIRTAMREAEVRVRRDEPISLEKDPKTGIYRPTDRQD